MGLGSLQHYTQFTPSLPWPRVTSLEGWLLPQPPPYPSWGGLNLLGSAGSAYSAPWWLSLEEAVCEGQFSSVQSLGRL